MDFPLAALGMGMLPAMMMGGQGGGGGQRPIPGMPPNGQPPMPGQMPQAAMQQPGQQIGGQAPGAQDAMRRLLALSMMGGGGPGGGGMPGMMPGMA